MTIRRFFPCVFAIAAVSILAAPVVAQANDPFLRVLTEDEMAGRPSVKYASFSKDDALAELRRRGVIFDEVPAEKAVGVVAPIRLTARLNGLHIHGTLPAEQAVVSPFEILDARLALSLWDFADVLKRHDIDELVHYSMFRPGLAGYSQLAPFFLKKKPVAPVVVTKPENPKTTPPGPSALPQLPRPDKTAAKGKIEPKRLANAKPAIETHAVPPVKTTPDVRLVPPTPSEGQTTSRHPAGLAIDAAIFRKHSGETLNVAQNFAGHIGASSCSDAPVPADAPPPNELHVILCEAARAGLFTYILSPNFNAAHHDHFHMEIKAGVHWTLVH